MDGAIGARASGHQFSHLRADIAAASAGTVGPILPWFLGLRRIIVFKGLAVSIDLQVEPCYLLGKSLAREDAPLAGVAMEERAVDRNNTAADQTKLANQQHEAAVHRLQRRPVLLAEVGDRPIAGLEVFQKPDQFQITARFSFQPARRPDLVDVAVKVKPQQIGRIVRRLPQFFRAPVSMPEAELCKIKGANKAIDRPYWILRPDIVFNPRRKQTGLIPTLAGLECAICHNQNRTPNSKKAEFLPSLVGQIS